MRPFRLAVALLGVAVACLALYGLLALWIHRGRAPALEALRPVDAAGETRAGSWFVPRSGLYDLWLISNGRATWTIDGQPAIFGAPPGSSPSPRTIFLTRGFHTVSFRYAAPGRDARLEASCAIGGAALQPFEQTLLYSSSPAAPGLFSVLFAVRAILRVAIVAMCVVALILIAIGAGRAASDWIARRVDAGMRLRLARASAIGLPLAIVIYGGLLRFDALTVKYGPVTSPAWLRWVQNSSTKPIDAIRPVRLAWSPEPEYVHRDGPPTHYLSDPYTYLSFAREMRSFYAAHYREPLFPYVTRAFLHLLRNQDVAVSFASMLFSILAVAATYWLGSLAFSRWVGAAAAVALAIEYDVISWGVGGWRDDAFTCAVVLSAWAMVRYLRLPTGANALIAGAIGGAACLVRITSVSFLLPGYLLLFVAVKRPMVAKLKGFAIVALAMVVVAGPFVFNCWRVYGDPLYAINVHTRNYLLTEGQSADTTPSAIAYVGEHMRAHPVATLDTIVLGLTEYPFLNKWAGFDEWAPGVGLWLSRLALVGLALFAFSAAGRLLLVVLATSLIPYAATWRLLADWRFTEHAYPFFLIASFVPLWMIGKWVWSLPQNQRIRRPTRVEISIAAAIVLVIAAGVYIVQRGLPAATFREALARGEDATIIAGERDRTFIGSGWAAKIAQGNVTAWVSRDAHSTVSLPLPRAADYAVTVRLDPFPRPPLTDRETKVRVFFNGTLVSTASLQWTAGRFGAYEVRLPKAAARAGRNDLTFMPETETGAIPGLREGDAFMLWYVRIRPLS